MLMTRLQKILPVFRIGDYYKYLSLKLSQWTLLCEKAMYWIILLGNNLYTQNTLISIQNLTKLQND